MSLKYLTQCELNRFFSGIHTPRERALFAVIYHYGLRVSEVTLLQLKDVDLERQSLYIHRLKEGQNHLMPLLSNTGRLLEGYLPERQPTGLALFTGRQGNLGRHRIAQLFKQYAHQAGLDGYSVHCLRHSIATHLLEAGLDIAYVQDHLGHVRIESTKVYAQITDRRRQEAFQQMERCPEVVKLSVGV